jgi:GT2 family glycosyltransferase
MMKQIAQPAATAEERHSDHPRVQTSIIIVSYNGKEKLSGCLSSVLRTLPDDCEVIVVDNASSEGNAEMVEGRFPGVTLIRSEVNLGFAAGCNLGVRRAGGTYLVFLNPDTLVEEGWLEALISPLYRQNNIGLVTAKIVLLDQPDRLNACGCNIHLSGLTLCRGMGHPRQWYSQPDEVGAISGAAFVIRRHLFEKLGGFDEMMFLYMEDIDLSLRAKLAGWTSVYTPDCVIFHDYQLRITPLKVFWQERNRYLMLIKNFKWRTLVALLPALVLAEFIIWSFVLLKDRHNIGNKRQAYSWVRVNWAAILNKRAATQSLRAVSDRELLKCLGFKLDFGQATGGVLATLANLLFNPIFFLFRCIVWAVVWW